MMHRGTNGCELVRDLQDRLARRRQVEAAMREHKRRHAHRDSFLFWNHLEEPILKTLNVVLRAAGLYSRGVHKALEPRLRPLRLEFESLPAGFDGFRILHLADLHIDGLPGLAEVVADVIADAAVDLCVMTGDYRFKSYGPCDGVYPGLRTILSAVRTRHGVVGILGNHDEAEIAVELEKMGVRMLINEPLAITREGSSLWMIGVDDPHCYGCDDLEGALEGVPEDSFKILLAHTPELYEEASRRGIRIYVCGHTHAGQIRLPLIGEIFRNADCPRAYAQGEWQHGAMLGHTSAGVGCSGLPVRYNCAPEIPVIELARKKLAQQSST